MKEMSMSKYHIRLIEKGLKWTTIRSIKYAGRFNVGDVVKLKNSNTLILITGKETIKIKDIDDKILESEGYKGQRQKFFNILKWFLKDVSGEKEVVLLTFKKLEEKSENNVQQLYESK